MRIGIVNPKLLTAEAIRRVIARSGKHDVAWMAQDGAEAVARCKRDRPDLVLMDLFMPRLDGVETTRQIMAHSPCAIIVATAKVDPESGLQTTLAVGQVPVTTGAGYEIVAPACPAATVTATLAGHAMVGALAPKT